MQRFFAKIYAYARIARHRKAIIAVALPALALALYGLYVGAVSPRIERRNLIAAVAGDEQLKPLADRAQKWEQTYKREPKNTEAFVAAGFNWKSIGDATNNKGYYKLALKAYEDGIRASGTINSFLYASAGHMYRNLGNVKAAEERYRDAIRVSHGSEYSFYLNLIELYRFDMHKPRADVLAIFDEGMRRLYNATPLLIERAAYFESQGEIEAAIADYEKLAAIFPRESQYADVVRTLRAKLGSTR